MYLITLEDGSTYATKEISNDDYSDCNNGYMQIVDISDPEKPLDFFDDEWTEIEIR